MSIHRGHFVPKSVKYVWKIQNFLGQTGRLDSPTFLLTNAHFSVQIYPDGQCRDHAGYVSIYLYKASSNTMPYVLCTMLLERTDGSILESDTFIRSFPLVNDTIGFDKFIEKSELTRTENNLGPWDTLTVSCYVRDLDVAYDYLTLEEYDYMVEAETQVSLPETSHSLSKNLEEMYLSGCQPDVVMDVRGKKFSAHRLILSARSSVFRSTFEHDMKDKETGVINITDCDPESFEAFLLFLYSDKLNVVTSTNALDLYITADKYNVQELKKECSKCLVRNLSVYSFCDVIRLAARVGDRELFECATTYFIKKAKKIRRTLQWRTLMREDSTLIDELLLKRAKAIL